MSLGSSFVRPPSGTGAEHHRLLEQAVAVPSAATQAIVATAHKLARLVYSVLKHGTAYVQQGLYAYEQQYRPRSAAALARRAGELGYELVPATNLS